MSSSPSTISPCPTCQGDPHVALTCSACRGAAVYLPSPDGSLMWPSRMDAATFRARHLRIRTHRIFHAVLALSAFACVVSLPVSLAWSGDWTSFASVSFWQAGHVQVMLWWLGWSLACFLIFRVRLFSDQPLPLPTWGRSKQAIDIMETRIRQKSVAPVLDVSLHVHASVWELLERAYDLAKQVERAEVQPIHLFAAALASSAGGVFLTRLGASFETIRPGLAMLIKRGETGTNPVLSHASRELLLQAYLDAREQHRRYVGVMEIFSQTFSVDEELQTMFDAAGYPPRQVERVAEWIRLQELLKEEHERFAMLAALKPSGIMNRTKTSAHTSLVNQLGDDLTLLAREGRLRPLIGRTRELAEVWRLFESGRPAVVLVGEAGVGKTALLEEIARRMVEEDVPSVLFDQRLVSVSIPRILSGGDVGEAMERLLTILNEVAASGNIVLAIEGIDALAGLGLGGSLDLAEMLATNIERLQLPIIATTTPRAWSNDLERRNLGQRLAKVVLEELSPDDALRVLMASSGAIEYQQRVFFSEVALEQAVDLSHRYLHETCLPQNAIDIAQQAAVLTRTEKGEMGIVGAQEIARIIQDKTRIPVEAVTQTESSKLLNLEQKLHGRVIGQDEAVTAVSQALRRARAQVREGKRPIANFLFLGPTGVGKTELAKALAAEYFGSEQSMIRLDMSEYQDPSAIRRVIGTPGDEHGGLLTEAVRRAPFSLILLDELEKAHQDVLTLFLQVMDDGRLTDGVGRTIDFTNAMLIATSNAGTDFIQQQVKQNVPLEQIKTGLMEQELRGIFKPEFLNRFDGVIVFKPLTLDDVTQIAWLLINGLANRLEREQGIALRAEDAGVERLAQAGFDPLFGARPLRRVIQEQVENGLADLILRQAVRRRDTLLLKTDGTLEVQPRVGQAPV